MTDEELKKIEDRAKTATAGPWTCDVRTGVVAVYHGERLDCLDGSRDYCRAYFPGDWSETEKRWVVSKQNVADAEFIANARQDIPKLIAALGVANLQVEEARRTAEYWKAEHLAGNLQNGAMRELLEWMDRVGGLGLDVHARIRAVLDKRVAVCGCPCHQKAPRFQGQDGPCEDCHYTHHGDVEKREGDK